MPGPHDRSKQPQNNNEFRCSGYLRNSVTESLCDRPAETPVPYEPGPGGGLYAIGELARLRLPDLAALFADTTGGRALSFLRQDALEKAIQLISQEVHRQYILTFEPKTGEAGAYHRIRVAVKNRPGLRVTTRLGYWAIQ